MSDKLDSKEYSKQLENLNNISNFLEKCDSRARYIVKFINKDITSCLLFGDIESIPFNGILNEDLNIEYSSSNYLNPVYSMIGGKLVNLTKSFPKRWLFEDFEEEFLKGVEEYNESTKLEINAKQDLAKKILKNLNLSEEEIELLRLVL